MRKLPIIGFNFLLTVSALVFPYKNWAQHPGGVSGSLTSWFKANTTIPGNITISSGSDIATWKSDIGTQTLSQSNQSFQPDFVPLFSTTANFNFNPAVQFGGSSGSVLFNSSTTNDLVGTAGTIFLICNSYAGSSSSNGNGLTYYYNSNFRYQMKPGFRVQVGTGSLGWTCDVNATGSVPASAPPESGFILVSRSMGANFRSRKNADSIPLNHSGINTYFPATQAGFFLGSQTPTPSAGFPFNGAISEVITFNSSLGAGDINKVESYLAVKYGITLSQSSAFGAAYSNYTASNGALIWDAAANNGYAKNITGIGRDDASALHQKQSRSVHNNALVYLYNDNTGGSFPAMNTDNTSSLATDLTFLMIGDNGMPNTPDLCIFNSKAQRMQRTWKVNNTGAVSTITIAVDQSAIAPAIKNIIVSADPTFPPASTAIYPLSISTGKLYAALTLNNNEYFSFATDSIVVTLNVTQPTCTNPTGGSVLTTIIGGNPPFVYAWSPTGQATADLGNAGTGTHSLVVTQGTCQSTFEVQLVAPGAPTSPVVNQPSICPGNFAALDVQNPDPSYTYHWYTTATGGTAISTGTSFATPALSTSTTYFVESTNGTCTSIRTPVTVTVTIVTDPVVNAATICTGNSATLTIQNPVAGQVYNWYTASTGSTPVGAGTSYSTPALSNNTTYYAEATNGACTGVRVPVNVSVSVITNPLVDPETVCTGTTATLTVQNPVTGQTYNWYTSAAGGTSLASGTSYTTAPLNNTTTYYVEPATGACTGTRVPVTVSITTIADPIVGPVTACQGNTALLTVQNPVAGQIYTWYSTASGGSALATGTSYTTIALPGPANYYVEASNGNCTGIRTVVNVSITTITDAIVDIPFACQGTSATLTVQNPVAGQIYAWYSTATGGTSIGFGTGFSTPPLNAATTYYVEASNGACNSRVPVTVIPAIIAAPLASGGPVCPGTSANLVVQNPVPGITYSWYNVPGGGASVATGTAFTSPVLSAPTSYYVEASDGTCTSIRTMVTINLVPPLPSPVVTATGITTSSITFTWAPVTGASGYQVSLNGGTYITPSSGHTGTSHVVTVLALSQTVSIKVIALKTAGGCADSNPGEGKGTTYGMGFYMPTAFTPNNDLLNDIIKPHLPGGAQLIYFIIYNRWGQKVFSTGLNDRGWDGKLLGKLQENGTYVWVCRYTYINGLPKDEKGSFLLLH